MKNTVSYICIIYQARAIAAAQLSSWEKSHHTRSQQSCLAVPLVLLTLQNSDANRTALTRSRSFNLKKHAAQTGCKFLKMVNILITGNKSELSINNDVQSVTKHMGFCCEHNTEMIGVTLPWGAVV